MNLAELKKAQAKAKREGLELAMLQQLRALSLTDGMEREWRFHPVRLWRLDFAYPTQKIALEVEGAVFSGGRHTRGEGFTEDVAKYNEAAIAGWTVVRATAAHVKSGQALKWVEAALARPTVQ